MSAWKRFAIFAVAGAVAAVVVLLTSDGAPAPDAGSPAGSTRVVLVATGVTPPPSEPDAPLHALYTGGTMPAAETTATVMTDEDCAPDANGVSHCTNAMRLADGSELTVMHPHRMSEVPCLSPGETVTVKPA